MSQDGMKEYRDEHAIKPAESEEAQADAAQAPVIAPPTASSLLSGPLAKAQRQALVQNVAQNFGNKSVQRMVDSLRRSASAGTDGGPLEQDLSARIQSERSNGQSLDAGVRREVEQSLGHDLSAVRVHTGSTAAELSAQMGAKAFTTGRDIFFGEGTSPSDRSLLTHEATHTIQQGMSEDAPSSIGAVDTAHEHAAEHNAANASAGPVQREADDEEMAGPLQREADDEEMAGPVQREADDEEMAGPIQREAEEEEMAGPVEREAEEEEMAGPIEREAEEEEMPGPVERMIATKSEEEPPAA